MQSKYLDSKVRLKDSKGSKRDLADLMSRYPERYMECHDRTKQLQTQFYWAIRNKQISKSESVAILCFTHGALVKQFNRIITPSKPFDANPVSYCAISAMVVSKKRSKCHFDLYDDHLTIDI